jgi:hypothetical protein
VAEFGDADLVARTMTRAGGPATTALLVETFRALLLLGVVGLLAVGASGLLAWSAGGLFGKAFVSGDAPGVAYTAARCADLREYAPGSATCAAAAVSHHFDEVVGYRLAAGVLGLLVLVVWLAVTRPWRRTAGRWQASYGVLPATFVPTVGSALFGAAALMLPYGLLDLVASGAGHGSGALITAGAVSAAAFLGFAVLW